MVWYQVGLRALWGAFLLESSSSPREIQEPGNGATAPIMRGSHGPIWCSGCGWSAALHAPPTLCWLSRTRGGGGAGVGQLSTLP